MFESFILKNKLLKKEYEDGGGGGRRNGQVMEGGKVLVIGNKKRTTTLWTETKGLVGCVCCFDTESLNRAWSGVVHRVFKIRVTCK